jgi:Ca2+-binding RTX toxin-like protein
MRGTLRLGSAALALAGLLALVTLADSTSAGNRDGPRERLVRCTYSADTQTLFVRLKAPDVDFGNLSRLPQRIRRLIRDIELSSSAAIDLRIGEITVLEGNEYGFDDGYSSGPIRCTGGRPTVSNTDTVVVRKGKRVGEGYLFLDFRYGLLGPGATDEGDGSSEVELDVDLDGGEVFGRMTRGPDEVVLDYVDGRTAVNLNATEAVDDADLQVGPRDSFYLQGGGSGDELSVEQSPPLGKVPFLGVLEGGEGDDSIRGGPGSDALSGGFGSDQVDAGAGPDFVFAFGGSDVIDCGPGRDTVLVIGKRHRLHDCERKQDEESFHKQKRRKARAMPKVAGAKVISPVLRRSAKRARRG